MSLDKNSRRNKGKIRRVNQTRLIIARSRSEEVLDLIKEDGNRSDPEAVTKEDRLNLAHLAHAGVQLVQNVSNIVPDMHRPKRLSKEPLFVFLKKEIEQRATDETYLKCVLNSTSADKIIGKLDLLVFTVAGDRHVDLLYDPVAWPNCFYWLIFLLRPIGCSQAINIVEEFSKLGDAELREATSHQVAKMDPNTKDNINLIVDHLHSVGEVMSSRADNVVRLVRLWGTPLFSCLYDNYETNHDWLAEKTRIDDAACLFLRTLLEIRQGKTDPANRFGRHVI